MTEDFMPVLYLLCGLPGSGKTTQALRLEGERGALRLCPDQWITALYGEGIHRDRAKLDSARTPIEALQWQVAAKVLSRGINVVLENGFWSRKERQDYRARAEALGAHVELIFLDVPPDELWARLQKRNAELPPDTFHVSESDFNEWLELFEPPTADELAQGQGG
jgi:predicted kinase